MPEKPSIPRPIVHPRRFSLPIPSFDESSSSQAIERNIESITSQPEFSPNELYIPEAKPLLAVNKMFCISTSQFSPVEEWQYANRCFVK